MEKQKAIEILEKQRAEINGLKNISDSSSSPAFTKWHRDTQIAVEKIFGKKNRHIKDFLDIFTD